jgi:hypothetical protein
MSANMAGSSDDFSLICEGLFEPWHQATPSAVAAASAAAAKQPEDSKDGGIGGIVEEITTFTPHAIGAKRRKVADVGMAAASAAAAKKPGVSKGDGIVEETTTFTPHAIGAQRREVDDVGNPRNMSEAISSAPWKRPNRPYLDAGHGSSRSSTDSRK